MIENLDVKMMSTVKKLLSIGLDKRKGKNLHRWRTPIVLIFAKLLIAKKLDL